MLLLLLLLLPLPTSLSSSPSSSAPPASPPPPPSPPGPPAIGSSSPIFAFLAICVHDFYPALECGDIKPGTVLILRYQGPKGAPGMPEMLGTIISLRSRQEVPPLHTKDHSSKNTPSFYAYPRS
ncbi:hypothetical protein M405DRAFT_938629 [Rhizopogon salebrosus TDB-379]|nr:hypothetical protein M405DRAFT_938629 [Rhizopogon salebrosus TDB-379]